MSFHTCQLLSAEANPTKKPLYLVCVSVVDPQKRTEWSGRQDTEGDDEEDPEQEYDEETKLKFFDF